MSGIFDMFRGSITSEVLTFNPDAIPEPDTLHIRMTRGERRIVDELHKQFGGFEHVVIDVDGERHEFSADSLIRLLESYEGAHDKSRWFKLFGTPERAARTLTNVCQFTHGGELCDRCQCYLFGDCDRMLRLRSERSIYDALLEWLKGGSDGE